MLPRGPDISSMDMRLLAASGEPASTEESEPVAMGLGCPLGCWGLARPCDNRGVSWLNFGVIDVQAALGSRFAGSA